MRKEKNKNKDVKDDERDIPYAEKRGDREKALRIKERAAVSKANAMIAIFARCMAPGALVTKKRSAGDATSESNPSLMTNAHRGRALAAEVIPTVPCTSWCPMHFSAFRSLPRSAFSCVMRRAWMAKRVRSAAFSPTSFADFSA